MMIASTVPVRNRDGGGPAAQVFAFTVLCGCVLGAAGAVGVGLTLIAVNGLGSDVFTAAIYVGIFVAGVGAQVGVAVGIVVGLALALLVRFGQGALGPRVVARLMPVLALACTTLPFVIVVACVGAPAPAVGLLLLDASFTVIGALLVGRYYLRRAEPSPVH
jgi:hypothetical protein